jgi:hypothetical protein
MKRWKFCTGWINEMKKSNSKDMGGPLGKWHMICTLIHKKGISQSGYNMCVLFL